MTEYFHAAVLCDELLRVFLPLEMRWFLDCTIGGGGFARALLTEAKDTFRLLGLDVDPDAITAAQKRLALFGERVRCVRRNYAEMEEVLEELEIGQVEGMVLDAGISSNLLEGDRGFSFRKEGPLDMRMDPDGPVTAKGVIDVLSEHQLVQVFRQYGEIRGAARLARAVKSAARSGKMRSTTDLALVVKEAFPNAGSKLLARTFQSLRVRVNSELDNLETFLSVAPSRLARGGRLAVVSFHSLEDRLVKHTFRALAKSGSFRLGTRKPIVPGEAEVSRNPRARSAKMRWIERVG